MPGPSALALALAAYCATAGARLAPRRKLLDAEVPACAWDDSQEEAKCRLNTAALERIDPFAPSLKEAEDAFYECFDSDHYKAACSGDQQAPPAQRAAPEATPSATTASGSTVEPLGTRNTPARQSYDGAAAQCPNNGYTNPLAPPGTPTQAAREYGFDAVQIRDVQLPDDALCDQEGSPPVYQAAGQVLMRNDDGACTACPSAECMAWMVDSSDRYSKECTGLCVYHLATSFAWCCLYPL